MKRVITIVVGVIVVAVLGVAGYLHFVHARQTALDKVVQNLGATGRQALPADLAKIEISTVGEQS